MNRYGFDMQALPAQRGAMLGCRREARLYGWDALAARDE